MKGVNPAGGRKLRPFGGLVATACILGQRSKVQRSRGGRELRKMGRRELVIIRGWQVLDCICGREVRNTSSDGGEIVTMHLHIQLFIKHDTCINCMVVLEDVLNTEVATNRAGDRSLFRVG